MIRRLALLALVPPLAAGCGGPPVIVMSEQAGATAERTEADEVATILSALRPDTLGFAEEVDAAVRQLNRWAERAEALSGAEGDVADRRFAAADARHFRDRLLDAAVVDAIVADTPDDLARVRKLFAHVVRHVERVGSDATPRTTFEVRLIGRGTAAERAWLFCDLVRQLKLEAALLVPDADVPPPEEGGPFVVAVFADGEAYLFDPAAGLPVPAPGQPAATLPSDVVPATYRQVLEDPSPWAFASGTWPADASAVPKLLVVGTEADRRGVVDAFAAMLPGDVTAIFYDPLEDTPEGPGVRARLEVSAAEAGLETTIDTWPYPAARVAAFDAIAGSEADRLALAMLPFDVPLGPDGPERDQLTARLDHLQGRVGDASKVYQLVRVDGSANSLKNAEELSANERTMYRLAADDAHYWIALCQLEQRNAAAAAKTARAYLDAGGARAAAAEVILALAEAKLGKTASAAERIKQLVVSGSADPGLAWLASQWSDAATDDASGGDAVGGDAVGGDE